MKFVLIFLLINISGCSLLTTAKFSIINANKLPEHINISKPVHSAYLSYSMGATYPTLYMLNNKGNTIKRSKCKNLGSGRMKFWDNPYYHVMECDGQRLVFETRWLKWERFVVEKPLSSCEERQASLEKELLRLLSFYEDKVTTHNVFIREFAYLAISIRDIEKVTYFINLLDQAENYYSPLEAKHLQAELKGVVAIFQQDIDKATFYLNMAAESEPSSFMKTYGPNLLLANMLLPLGEKQAVINYLEKVNQRYWNNDEKVTIMINNINKGREEIGYNSFDTEGMAYCYKNDT
ncbi:hypothetical protein LP316_10390 [Thalassotalea sp. LPB0316]|uniref:hypothetical protein n=1 Tax=Thalassotalea sp. LPB0316 TaxID=2769490 RepID=UPI0018693E40|nr:hypothetical protein [Thalassotalea sp. LPB0316]QOL24738.1 hypothetical protein LP316_10390 [Thalassotalea sp. LPB0316]